MEEQQTKATNFWVYIDLDQGRGTSGPGDHTVPPAEATAGVHEIQQVNITLTGGGGPSGVGHAALPCPCHLTNEFFYKSMMKDSGYDNDYLSSPYASKAELPFGFGLDASLALGLLAVVF
ncbi:hypothetical protein M514_23028 [Trichuris suis]|uniref:Uncharacterized protein n=1 Tax=Trichuris suis TaxID=68888 RepID=A0A085N5S0_9BILA|nr:hypothetical protein M514_23028 [Trichuris suis]